MDKKYIVIEIQTAADGTIGTLVYNFDSENEAESKYHSILSAAAVSGCPVHSAMLMDEQAIPRKHEFYKKELENGADES